MKIATWNVNSIRARLARVCRWLEREAPDILCLQELKAAEDAFPRDEIREVGYHAAVYGQKTYSGVAILSGTEPEAIIRGMGPGDQDPEARLISATVLGVRVISAYFPNGRAVGSAAYRYKLEWMDRLRAFLEATASATDALVLAGDFNVAPRDVDVEDAETWSDSVLCHAESRAALARIKDWGFVDLFEMHHPEGRVYSWWDYQRLAFPRNDGLRIDHLWGTAPLAQRCTRAWIDRDERKGKKTDTPSDHAPVVTEFD
jgi:exodeoxyribonuclease-3